MQQRALNVIAWIGTTSLMALACGCASNSPRWIEQPWTPLANVGAVAPANVSVAPSSDGNALLVARPTVQSASAVRDNSEMAQQPQSAPNQRPGQPQQVVRGQDGGYPLNNGPPPQGTVVPPPTNGGTYVPAPDNQYPQLLMPPAQVPTPQVGAPNELLPYVQQPPPMGNESLPQNFADIDVLVSEAQTGRLTFGAAYNSNSGLVGQIIVDERNFDIWGFPRSFRDIVDGTAWRGRGQGFRLELVPGNEVQRYLVSFTEPYLFDSRISFSASGYFFDRRYFDWDEQRLGGRLALGYRLTPDLSVSVGTRMENVDVHDPRVLTSPELNAALGDNALFLGQVSLINDTRDHPFMATEGSYLEMSYFQGFGDFSYPRGDVDYRRYFLIYQRPDGSGRHTLSLGTRLGFSGPGTPVFENYFAGGFSTLRGFDFRGASPVEGGVRVGGEFQWLNSVEYTFPITADDMFKGVFFVDFGTVERSIKLSGDNFRVAPGFGFRVHMPVGGAGGAPLAFDFAFPVAEAATDDRQVFSFYMGVLR